MTLTIVHDFTTGQERVTVRRQDAPINRALDDVAACPSMSRVDAECLAAVDLAAWRAAQDIRTNFDPKPIGSRDHDWSAWLDSKGPEIATGYGATEAEAIADLMGQFDV